MRETTYSLDSVKRTTLELRHNIRNLKCWPESDNIRSPSTSLTVKSTSSKRLNPTRTGETLLRKLKYCLILIRTSKNLLKMCLLHFIVNRRSIYENLYLRVKQPYPTGRTTGPISIRFTLSLFFLTFIIYLVVLTEEDLWDPNFGMWDGGKQW